MALNFHHHELPNGLTVIAEANDDMHTAAVGFFVKTGTRDEDKPVMGVSHFLEHMMFKGTARRSADDVNREFDELGANYNAFTSHENTVYYAQVLPEFLPRAVDLLGDMLRPALRGEDFDMEKNVILEEIGMYDDRPQWRLQDTLLEEFYGEHPLSYRVLGTKRIGQGELTADQMKRLLPASATARTTSPSPRPDSVEFKTRCLKTFRSIAGHWTPTGAEPRSTPSRRPTQHDRVDGRPEGQRATTSP